MGFDLFFKEVKPGDNSYKHFLVKRKNKERMFEGKGLQAGAVGNSCLFQGQKRKMMCEHWGAVSRRHSDAGANYQKHMHEMDKSLVVGVLVILAFLCYF